MINQYHNQNDNSITRLRYLSQLSHYVSSAIPALARHYNSQMQALITVKNEFILNSLTDDICTYCNSTLTLNRPVIYKVRTGQKLHRLSYSTQLLIRPIICGLNYSLNKRKSYHTVFCLSCNTISYQDKNTNKLILSTQKDNSGKRNRKFIEKLSNKRVTSVPKVPESTNLSKDEQRMERLLNNPKKHARKKTGKKNSIQKQFKRLISHKRKSKKKKLKLEDFLIKAT